MTKAEERANEKYPKRKDGRLRAYQCTDDDIRKLYAQGYRKAEKDTLEKAVSWMDSVLPNVTDRETIEWLINDFRKAMEGEK